MPLFEFLCTGCGKTAEILVMGSDPPPACPFCGGASLKKLLSAHSSHPGTSGGRLPGPGDSSCCGKSAEAAGCAGPGSCCGKAF